MRRFEETETCGQVVLCTVRYESSSQRYYGDSLTPIAASHTVRKGFCTAALSCPHAATILFTDLMTSGCVVISSHFLRHSRCLCDGSTGGGVLGGGSRG